jgi:hypothetical protein
VKGEEAYIAMTTPDIERELESGRYIAWLSAHEP